MNDDKEYECLKKEEYDKLGVTPKELYYRQNGLCWLEIAYDKIDEGDPVPGDIYCTDGEEYARTSDMLNPTIECAQCMAGFLLAREHGMFKKSQIDRFLFTLLVTISKSKSVDGSTPEFYMSRTTLDRLEEYVYNTTISSSDTNPIKVTAAADILLFGIKVNYLSEMEDGSVMLQPGNFLMRLPHETTPS